MTSLRVEYAGKTYTMIGRRWSPRDTNSSRLDSLTAEWERSRLHVGNAARALASWLLTKGDIKAVSIPEDSAAVAGVLD